MGTKTLIPLEFSSIQTAVAKQFAAMQNQPLFRVGISPERLWSLYLASFPEGTNPIYRERTEHDCSTCKNYIRDVGNVVAIVDGELVNMWEVPTGNESYDRVCNAMSDAINSMPIVEPFLHYSKSVGAAKTFEAIIDGGSVESKAWTHFHANIQNQFVAKNADIATKLSEYRSSHDALARALSEITIEAIDLFDELVGQNSLYRGEEFRGFVNAFRALKVDYVLCDNDEAKDRFVWLRTMSQTAAMCRIRNSVVGTLLVELSQGDDVEAAVRSYESKVAPTNYKRPTALVTPRMVAQAKSTVEELGLTSALERRFAVTSDVTVNNVLFADRKSREIMLDPFAQLAKESSSRKPKNMDKVEKVTIDRFISEVLPKATSIEVLFENRHVPNLVSLIAPSDPTSEPLFKWPNRFSWSYNGEVTDSIKERVKAAGGNVSGDLRCSLSWHNHDDLDLHLVEPGGTRIYYGNRRSTRSGGQLDVDMNAGGGTTREPVENIFYASHQTMQEGTYQLSVNQFTRRETSGDGFEVEIDWMGTVHSYAAEKSPLNKQTVVVAEWRYTHANGLELITPLKENKASRKEWGIATETFQPVSLVMLSPNHWDGYSGGNQHYFFMLDGAVNDGGARGFYNEFLDSRLDPHRKVMEMVASKLKPSPASEQLSGLGFSSTKKNSLVCRVTGSLTRTIEVTF